MKDKAQHAVVLDKQASERLNKDVTSYRLITVATLVDRMKINGSVARKVLKDMEDEGKIKKIVSHARLNVYSMSRISRPSSQIPTNASEKPAPLAAIKLVLNEFDSASRVAQSSDTSCPDSVLSCLIQIYFVSLCERFAIFNM